MNILVLNCGSSSIKFQLLDLEKKTIPGKGLLEDIDFSKSDKNEKIKCYFSKFSSPEKPLIIRKSFTYESALKFIIQLLTTPPYGVIKSVEKIFAIGHRVVHGGEDFFSAVLIDKRVISKIKKSSKLAPLHNLHNLEGIIACTKLLPDKPQVAVFDTTFHQTLPQYSYLYGLPYKYYTKYKIRKYGFHGTSHSYVMERACAILNKRPKDLKIISCHLGNGSSITAIKNGKSIDTSMGFTPLEGLIMGTRCGDIDPAIVPFLMKKENYSPEEMDRVLNYESGLIGITGFSNDMREICKKSAIGNKRAQLAIFLFTYRIKKYISAYFGILSGADVLIFTAGIGENSSYIRNLICEGLEQIGIKLDEKRNNKIVGKEGLISKDSSKVKILCIPTNEELFIAKETMRIVKKKQ